MKFMEKLKRIKAFTLIELLAIIVILAIIAVITVPLILNVIDNSKKGAAISSAYGFKDAVDKKYLVSSLSDDIENLNGEYTITNGNLSGNGLNNEAIPVSGVKPTSGTLTYLNNKLQSGCLVISGYEVRYSNDKFTSNGKGNCGNIEEPEITYEVSFNTNGGSNIDSQNIVSGQIVDRPENPTKDGYTFAGWYSDSELTEIFDFNTTIIEDIILYAKWTENITYYSFTFNTNGGSSIDTQTIASGQTATKPTNPTKDGYTFLGWYYDSELTEKFNFNTSIVSNTDVYAYWVSSPTKDDGFTYIDPTWVLANPVYYNPTNPSASCNLNNSSSTQGVTTGCLRWYAYSFKDGIINMILDHNINPTNIGVAWVSESDYEAEDSTLGVSGMCSSSWNTSYGKSCKGPLTALKMLKTYTENWTTSVTGGYSSYTGVASNGSTNYTINYTSTYGYKARLISIKEIAYITNQSSWADSNSTNISSLPSFLTYGLVANDNVNVGGFSYWTGSPHNQTYYTVYNVYYTNAQGVMSKTDKGGIRPVITVSKSLVIPD